VHGCRRRCVLSANRTRVRGATVQSDRVLARLCVSVQPHDPENPLAQYALQLSQHLQDRITITTSPARVHVPSAFPAGRKDGFLILQTSLPQRHAITQCQSKICSPPSRKPSITDFLVKGFERCLKRLHKIHPVWIMI
jgi:hypothetical protein